MLLKSLETPAFVLLMLTYHPCNLAAIGSDETLQEFLVPKKCESSGVSNDELVFCPSQRNDVEDRSLWPCLRPIDICNSIPDCPNGEDENAVACMYFLAQNRLMGEMLNIISSYHEKPIPEGNVAKSAGGNIWNF